jgi:hypothetical protein
MANLLADAITEGMAKSFAVRMDPDRGDRKEFTAIQMSQFRDEAVDSRMLILEKLEKKIQRLIDAGADGRVIQTYQLMHEQLGAQVTGGAS